MQIDLCLFFNRTCDIDEANYRYITAVVTKWAQERKRRSGARIMIDDNSIRVQDAKLHDDDLRFLLECIERMHNYPLLDEMAHGEVEVEFAQRVWDRMSIDDRVRWIQRYAAPEVSVFAARRSEIPPTSNGDEYALLASDHREA